ncbi:MAG: transporter substrate-binding domain-containing protein, partial [Acidimicrobiales bacterium]
APAARPVRATNQLDEVRVAVRVLPPFVERQGDGYTGLTADLWDEVASRLGVTTRYVEVGSVTEQLDAVRRGDVDVAATAISITSQRERSLDFSVPYFDAGLRIMVPTGQDVSLLSALTSLFTPSVLGLLAVFLAAVVVVGALVAIVERRTNADFQHRGWRTLGEGMWWATVTVSTVGYGDRVTRTTFGRVVTGAWILFGLVFVAQFTATVTTNLTVNELQSDITGPGDLGGHDVVTVSGTTAARYLENREIPFREVESVRAMVDEVAAGAAEAAVYDAPILAYERERVGSSRVSMVGALLTREYYGIAFPPRSHLAERVNRVLLEIEEDGTAERLNRQWFPSER